MLEKITDPTDVRLWEGSIPIRHRYTPGVAGEAFFKTLKDKGTFLASRCPECGFTYCPPRIFCERDFAGLEADTTVGPHGTLESFTVGYRGVEGEPLDEPQVLGLVRLDGADSFFLHFLVDWDRPYEIGAPVEAVLEAKRRRTGSILDVRGFRPARR